VVLGVTASKSEITFSPLDLSDASALKQVRKNNIHTTKSNVWTK